MRHGAPWSLCRPGRPLQRKNRSRLVIQPDETVIHVHRKDHLLIHGFAGICLPSRVAPRMQRATPRLHEPTMLPALLPCRTTTTHRAGLGVALAALLAGSALIAACDDGAVTDLNGLPSSGASGVGNGGFGSDNGGVGSPGADGGTEAGGGATPARMAFQALLPELTQACGGACHVDGKGNAPAWLGPPDAYKSITTYKGIVVKDVATSTLLSKGRHEGPDLVDPLRSKVQGWLALEAQA